MSGDPMDIDDYRPISSSSNTGMYELEDDGAGVSGTNSVDNRPLNVRIGDKNWKTRLTAYEDLKNELSNTTDANTTLYEDYASWIPKITADSNAGALDAGVDCAIVFADKCPVGCLSSYYDKIYSNVVDKAFAGKASTFAKGKALLMKLMEVDEPTSCTLYLISRLGDKKPKVPPTCLEIIKEGIVAYGARVFPIKDIIACLSPVLNGSNGPAREQALMIMVELTRWIGKAPFNTMLENLRTAQKSEFDKMMADLEAQSLPAPVPTVYLRKSRPAPGSVSTKAGTLPSSPSAVSAMGGGLDGREFIEEIDLNKRLKGTEFMTLVADEKWSEQLKGLQILVDILGPTPKIKGGNSSEGVITDICGALKGFLRQGHLQVQVTTLKLFALIADGLRGEFTITIKPIVGLILSKCKEKRLTTEVHTALMVITKYCLNSIEIMLEDILDLIKNKKHPPHARICAMEYITAVAGTITTAILNDHLKPLVEALISVCEDSDPKVRDACAIALAAIASIVKVRGKVATEANKLIASLEASAPRVFKKIISLQDGSDGSSTSTSASTITTSNPPKTSTTTASKTSNGNSASISNNTSTATKRPSTAPGGSLSNNNSNSSSSNTGTGAATTKKSASNSTGNSSGGSKSTAVSSTTEDDNVDDLIMNLEEAEMALTALGIDGWESTFQEMMISTKWQDKVDALTQLSNAINSTQLGAKLSSAIVTYLAAKTANFKINNITVLKAVIQVAVDMASSSVGSSDKFSRPAAWELLKHFGDKLSEKKTAELIYLLLTSLSEVISITFVVKRMKVVMDKIKAPAAHQAYLEWMKQAVIEFGAGTFPIFFVSGFCQSEMENKVAGVRIAAIEVVAQLFHQIGPRFQSIAFSDDMKPQIKAVLEAEFEKVGYDPKASASAIRGPLAGGVSASTTAGNSASSTASGSALGGLDIPRNDLATLVDKNILLELNMLEGKTAWQNRKAAMESIISACEKSGHYIDCSSKNSMEIVKALKPRLVDTQANLKPIAATAIGHIISSLDPEPASKVFKTIVTGLLGGIQDNKKSMRDSTVQAMTVCATLGKDKGPADGTSGPTGPSLAEPILMSCFIAPAVESLTNPVGRQELLQFFVTHIENIKTDCNELVPVCVTCMQDKTAAVRSLAEQLLLGLISKNLITRQILDKATRDLPTAVKRTLQPSIDKMMIAGSGRPVAVPPGVLDKTSSDSKVVQSTATPALLERMQSLPVVSHTSHANQSQAQSTSSNPPPTSLNDEHSVVSQGSSRWFLRKTTKVKRLEEFYKMNWPVPPEDVGDSEFIALRNTWEAVMTNDLAMALFGPSAISGAGKNQDAFISAMNELTTQLEAPHAIMHTDLMLRYAAYILCIRETSSGLLKVLQLIYDILGLFIKASNAYGTNASNITTAIAAGVAIHDSEINIILPHLLERSGHKSDRHRQAFKSVLAQLSNIIIPPSKYVSLLIQGLSSNGKNKKSRVVCIEEIQRITEEVLNSGTITGGIGSILNKSAMKEIGQFMEAKDTDMTGKQACLELCFVLYQGLGSDTSKLIRMLGGGVEAGTTGGLSERTVSMIEERIKQKTKVITGAGINSGVAGPLNSPLRKGLSLHSHTIATAAAVSAAVAEIDAMDINHGRLQVDTDLRGEPMDIDYEYGNAPFKLEMTPPKPTARSPSQSKLPSIPESLPFKLDKTPVKSPQQVASQSNGQSLFRVSSPSSAPVIAVYGTDGADAMNAMDTSLTGVQADIASKIDAYLQRCYYYGLNESVTDTERLNIREGALDYMKILHEMAMGQWYKNHALGDDVQIPAGEAEALIVRLAKAIACGFDKPTPSKAHTDLNLDINVLSVGMATLFQLLKRSSSVNGTATNGSSGSLARGLSLYSIQVILKVCLGKLVDERLLKGSIDLTEDSYKMSTNITKGLNMIALRLAEDANNGLVIRALLKILLECALSEQALATATTTSPASSTLISPNASQPCSRLLLHVLSDEVSKEDPFSMPAFDLKGVLVELHEFYIKHPLLHVENDRPFRCAKTVLNEIVKCLGAAPVLASLRELDIPASAFISKLTGKLGHASAPEVSPELNAKVVAIIDEITSARDKMLPIKQLHTMKRQHPELDLASYLHRISSAFRRFVLDTLTKLDADGDENNYSNSRHDGNRSPSQYIERSASVSSVRSNTAEEALRILEGLKTRGNSTSSRLQSVGTPIQYSKQGTSSGLPIAARSPRSAISDKVRGSLNNLTAQLDLVPNATTSSAIPILGRTSSQESIQPYIPTRSEQDDSDLSSRVSRLVSHFNK